MKMYMLIGFQILFIAGSSFASGILEYKGQNYYFGADSTLNAIKYSLYKDEIDEEENIFEEYNVITDGKLFFIDQLPNYGIIEQFKKKGYIEHGDKIELQALFSAYDSNQNGDGKLKMECFYYGKMQYCNEETDYESMLIIGYISEHKIIITEIYLTEEDIDMKIEEFKTIYSPSIW